MSKHYVARVVFEVVERTKLTESYANKPATYGERKTTEIGSIMIKGSDLSSVKERLLTAAEQIEDM